MKLILAVGGNSEKEIVEKAWLKVGTPNILRHLNWIGTFRKDREHVKKIGVKTIIVTELMMGKNFYIFVCISMSIFLLIFIFNIYF